MVASNTLEPIVTWDGFKQAITRQFGGFDLAERARDDLAKLRQTTSVMAYVQRFLEILLRIPSSQIVDSDMRHRFIAGLKPQTQLQVKIANPQTLRDAMNLADRIDRVRPVWGTGRPVPQRTFPVHARSSGGPEPMILGSVKGRKPDRKDRPEHNGFGYFETKKGLERSPQSPYKPLSDAQRKFLQDTNGCFYCRKPHTDHTSRDCPLKQKQKGKSGTSPSKLSNSRT